MTVSDTHPEAEAVLLRSYAAMSPAKKLQRVVELNRFVEELAVAYGLVRAAASFSASR